MKIYVGNLPWSVDEEGLKKLFAAYNPSEVTLISDKFSGRSKGFGFVTIEDEASAKEAIAEMNKKEVEGRELTVNEAKPVDPDAPRRPQRSGGRFGGNQRSFGGRDSGRDSGRRNFNRR